MKKLFLLLMVVGVFSSLGAKEFTREAKDMAGRIVEAKGYKCSKVDNASRQMFGGAIDVYCNGYSYKYELKNVGGRFVVTPK